VLTALMIAGNPGPWGFGVTLELAAAMLVISLVTNGAFTLALLVPWPLVRRLASGRIGARGWVYFASGLVGLNLVWSLWNRLAMAHQWASVRPFMTWLGLLQTAVLALIAIGVVAGCVALSLGAATRLRGAALLLVSLVLVPAMVAWNDRQESFHRTYDLEELHRVVNSRSETGAPAGERGGPVILLGVDGMCWSIAGPLMRAGQLPTLERLAASGTFGYLDNADESLSPSIWTTIYTGRSPRHHGVQHYEKMVLPRSGRSLPNPLFMKPSTASVYGLRYLLRYLGWTGAWETDWIGSADRRVAAIWEVASVFEKRVVVANPLVNLPSQPVNGAMVFLFGEPSSGALFPPELAQVWQPAYSGDHSGRTDESFRGLVELLDQEIEFTLELFRMHDVELGIYYTHFVDSISHSNWDFRAGDGFFLTDLPRSLDDDQWERLVVDNPDVPVFRAYLEMDRAIGRFIEAYPDATFLLVSDHGWTYSGYEHFGSPEGVVLLSGPGVRRGTLDDARTRDVTPTLLALLDIPLSRELEGRPLTEAFHASPDVQHIAAYGDAFRLAVDELDEPVTMDPDEIERLKALGYVQ
jgi:predicted AlkP superfamily phosphohydrolase/phosphomutase